MESAFSQTNIERALETCAQEPIHIPGTVQPHGCLVAIDLSTTKVVFCSQNTGPMLGLAHPDLLGHFLVDRLPREVFHALNNAMSLTNIETHAAPLGQFKIMGETLTLSAFMSDGLAILEFEPFAANDLIGFTAMRTITDLLREIETSTSEQELFATATEFLRHLSGYDRVMAYRFDPEYNGQVIAEHKRNALPSFMGLHFPSYDIPAQARAMMARLPVRVISDVAQTPIPLLAADPNSGPFDISLAGCRGVSAVHMEYLSNMEVKATMTLSIQMENDLWGIISFHHMSPRAPAAALREVLAHAGQVIATRLKVLKQGARLALVDRVDALKDNVLDAMSDRKALESFMATVMDILGATGCLLQQGAQIRGEGQIPGEPVTDALMEQAKQSGEICAIEALSSAFPELAHEMNGCAGALAISRGPEQCILFFRPEIPRSVQWAGNPQKDIEIHAGQPRLSPRGSFSAFLEKYAGQAAPWSEQDRYFAKRIWTLLNSVERQELVASLNRQQKIMIEELNHRVRNILALVRSVSEQAQGTSYGSLGSYSKTLEARIEALAASHDLTSGNLMTPVLLRSLIDRELEPFTAGSEERVTIEPSERYIKADSAPIFSLVIHELVTNAVKYGALSNDTGQVSIEIEESEAGLVLTWRESGGPPVAAPNELGFGSTLIEQAIPYELDGDVKLRFFPEGVEAVLHLPITLFETPGATQSSSTAQAADAAVLQERETKAEEKIHLSGKRCLLVEDSFVIAKATRKLLLDCGLAEVDIAGTVEDALDIIQHAPPDIALLDVNLGGKKTSAPIADALAECAIPFLFATGYGDSITLPDRFKGVMRLQKPVPARALRSGLAKALAAQSSGHE